MVVQSLGGPALGATRSRTLGTDPQSLGSSPNSFPRDTADRYLRRRVSYSRFRFSSVISTPDAVRVELYAEAQNDEYPITHAMSRGERLLEAKNARL